MLKPIIYDSMEQWVKYTDELTIHKGINNNRLQELKFWEKLIPSISYYLDNENDFTLEKDSIYVQLKLMYAALILIIDDIVDNSTSEVNSELMEHLTNMANNHIPFRRSKHTMLKAGLDLVQTIVDCANDFFVDNKTFYYNSLSCFVSGVNDEISVINKILNGESVTFNERVEACALQGAHISNFIDSERIYKKRMSINNLTMNYLSYAVGSYLALKNSAKTVISELANGEITSPLFILACALVNVNPITKRFDVEWYQSIANSQQFKHALEVYQIDLIKNIQKNFAYSRFDLPRFFTAVGALD
jgi:hypothetical protein